MKKSFLYLLLGALLAVLLGLLAFPLRKRGTSGAPGSSSLPPRTPPPASQHAPERLAGGAAGDSPARASREADPLRDWRSKIRREAARTSYYATRWAWSEALLPLVDAAAGWPVERLRAELEAVAGMPDSGESRLAREVLILALNRSSPFEALELADGSVSSNGNDQKRSGYLLQETFEAAAAQDSARTFEWLEEGGRVEDRLRVMPLVKSLARQLVQVEGDFATAGRLAALVPSDTAVVDELAKLVASREMDPRELESCVGFLEKGHQTRYFSFMMGTEVAGGRVPVEYARQLLSLFPGEADRSMIESYFDQGMNGESFASDTGE